MNKYIILTFIFISITACDKSAKPINYGEDQCDFCSMGIVQKTHAAQLVTEKGKQHKFDAIECMVNFVKDKSGKFNNATLLVVNYNQPGKMILAESASYLISKNLPSPMGAYLTAFASVSDAEAAQEKLKGEIYQWDNLKKVIKKDIHKIH
ncbi:copper-binding lipoprotein NosL [Psychroflexus torquis ATCC 700755]|uniref:Copper-binding lipoprotein NosL n=1 Tax=Psychroflexus torquis (strain ATCC 700755 / CIP 106069 / ACAM 623) TaxID=313595 RepID=K4IQD2_PSYTT|nr:nitrous oxide reductase accessory protein NosL [Psychroflexus torquis]AFU67705.1 copper-binding lipoprotein NosL [Psychroflexus torquis ATCC 700755]